MNDGTDGFSFVHQIERVVDLLQRQTVGNERVELNLADHSIFNHTRKLGTPLHAAKRGAAPYAPGDQLEWTGFNLLTRTGHANWALTAVVWGLMIGGLLLWTRSLGACIVMHATTNLLLGLYVLRHHEWALW